MNSSKKINALGVSPGIVYAKSYLLQKAKIDLPKEPNKLSKEQIQKKLNETIATTTKQLEKIKQISSKKLGAEKAEVFEAHIQIVLDPEMNKEITDLITNNKKNLATAISTVYDKYCETFKNMSDAYFQERATDIIDVKERMLCNLLGLQMPNLLNIDQEVILICDELTPSDTALLDVKYIKGIISQTGGRTSHAAIMARSLEIPTVLGATGVLKKIKANAIVALDGNTGEIEISPSIKEWGSKIASFKTEQKELAKYCKLKTKTKDGVELKVEANIGNPNDADMALKHGCEGVGLYRSEFLYMGNDNWPTEEEQYKGYKAVLEKMPNETVVIRTLDIGGDKVLPYYTFPKEDNPFLGNRAIRFCLRNKKIFRTQLRALGRASIHGKLAIMFPMIATVQEFLEAKKLTLKVFDELRKEKKRVSKTIQIGMMIEIPASAILADQFAKHADFFSIGTNDLIQYSLACDRMSKTVSYLYKPTNPSILRLVNNVIQCAHKENKWAGMCGEMAGDAKTVPLLLGMGLDSFSMSATSIPKARRYISKLTQEQCKPLVETALNCSTDTEVNKHIDKFLKQYKLI